METGNPTIDAQRAFEHERRRRLLDRARRRIGFRAHGAGDLPCLDPARRGAGRRLAGLREVPIESIVGTTEAAKSRSFDQAFRPPKSSRRRWEGLWRAGRRGAALPPVSLVRVGERHFVDDGHHRVSVARALGMAAIDAEVVELGRAG